VDTATGGQFEYDALLIATGAEPRRLALPGFDLPHVFSLRTFADARAIVAAAQDARSVAFVGAGFIGLEAAAALRARGLAVSIVAPEAVPMARILGEQLGEMIAGMHLAHGVAFHLGRKPVRLEGHALVLDDGSRVDADLVIVGAGVIPRTQLAEAAGLAVDNGILVDGMLQASIPGHYAAGDVARYPHAGAHARVEHWVHAERQGQCVADNLLGDARRFTDVPFFWTHQYDLELRVTGHLAGWDELRIQGTPGSGDFIARYYRWGTLVAAATAGRDRENLSVEAELAAA
jgi:NADPH-dependent 2,4-dienoyl-CoA reductase/sulfur reductase-like enzyme